MTFKNNPYKKNDSTYLSNHEYDNPKEYFKIITKIIADRFGNKPLSIIDVGCASGGFLYYLKNHINIVKGIGIDISDKHLMQARKVIPDFQFIEDSVLTLSNPNIEKYDICTFLGSMGIFDKTKKILQNLVQLIKKNGAVYIFDQINDYPVDMIMRYRVLSDENFPEWNSALNVRSKKLYELLIRKIDGNLKIKFYDFDMPYSIPETDNPMRSWTIETEERRNQLIVGTGQMLNFKIVEITC
tara:strand:+ start:64 stop:789 length:726 start_codon:yes stop_codon:yes gene_type:complete